MSREKFIHIAFTEDEKSRIKDFASQHNMTISEYCRQAIFEKIRRTENPELFQGSASSKQVDTYFLENINESMKKLTDFQQLILDRTNLLPKMNDLLKVVHLRSTAMDLAPEQATIMGLFRVKKALSVKEIVDMTSYDEKLVIDIIKVFQKQGRVNLEITTGRWTLSDD